MEKVQLPRSQKIGGKFQNTIETNMDLPFSQMVPLAFKMLKGIKGTKPNSILPASRFDKTLFDPKIENSFSWFGHSSLLVRFAGKNILFDPVFSDRASMFSFVGPKRFDYSEKMDIGLLPEVDLVVLSHDHYDHLDKKVIQTIHGKIPEFYCPLGMGKILEKWGVPRAKITEADWGDSFKIASGVEMVCAPSRHFSGRGLGDRATTLWCSWIFLAENSSFYFSGDSGYSPEFKTIGDLYGPFDFSFMECGQYNELWEPIHMMPEQSAQAAFDVKSSLTIPIHWGKFALAMHPWNDSPRRFSKKADELGLRYFFPHLQQAYDLKNIESQKAYWWDF